MDIENVLIVKTLGSFEVTWNGRHVCSGTKARDSQTTRLLQIILHFRDIGVERNKLEELLLDESNTEDQAHMFRNIIYYAKKRLQTAGVPGNEMIVYKNGRYYWNEAIPVYEDATEFEKLSEQAFEEEDNENDDICCKQMLLLAIATSIDAMAAGVSFEMEEAASGTQFNIFLAVLLIGVITFILSAIGTKLGSIVGTKYNKRAEIAGGVVLILLGIKIVLEKYSIIF
jgi:DNA-binding transcriptional MerR regulator